MKLRCLLCLFALIIPAWARAQNTPYQLKSIMDRDLQSPTVVEYQLQEFLEKQVPKLPATSSADEWTREGDQIRKRVLEDVVYHGWPSAWVNSPPRFEDLGAIPSGKGYTLHKLRYEVVPGFFTTALLYEPANLQDKAPAVLNVMGHHGSRGKAEDFQQKMCINEALRGMIALNLEWLGMGESYTKENSHWNGGHLDLVGANMEGLFFLAMRRGLDYLWQDAQVDQKRIAVTGLSGGGWQTIILTSLDERVNVSIPVAGYTSLEGRMALAPDSEAGDLEQNATDLLVGQDYSTLTAIRAPRPTLLINNAEDDCCFRAALVKPYIFEAVRPFFRLYGEEENLRFFENTTISMHNYEVDDQRQAYKFLDQHFGLSASDEPMDVGEDVKSFSELAGGLPKDNLTILGLARKFAGEISRPAIPSDAAARAHWADTQRANLQSVVRFKPVTVDQVWAVANSKHNGVESVSYRLLLSNGLSATGIWLKNIPTPDGAPLTIVLNDKGKKNAHAEAWDRMPEVADRMERGEQVFVADLLFTGDAAPEGGQFLFPEMMAAAGNRPLGMEAAQLIAVGNWAKVKWNAPSVRLESNGIRTQLDALIAAALSPHEFSALSVNDGMKSLQFLLDKPVEYDGHADLFCLDLYKYFDLDRLIAIAAPTPIHEHDFAEDAVKTE